MNPERRTYSPEQSQVSIAEHSETKEIGPEQQHPAALLLLQLQRELFNNPNNVTVLERQLSPYLSAQQYRGVKKGIKKFRRLTAWAEQQEQRFIDVLAEKVNTQQLRPAQLQEALGAYIFEQHTKKQPSGKITLTRRGSLFFLQCLQPRDAAAFAVGTKKDKTKEEENIKDYAESAVAFFKAGKFLRPLFIDTIVSSEKKHGK